MTTGREIFALLPKQPSAEREGMIQLVVESGKHGPLAWLPLHTEHNGHRGTLYVMSDALRLGNRDDSFRIATTAKTAQLIADRLDVMLPTTHVVDLAWRRVDSAHYDACVQAVNRPIDPDTGAPMNLAHRDRIKTHHGCVESRRNDHPLVVNFKHWVLTNKYAKQPTRAANYFFADQSAPYVSPSGIRMWQTLGLAHNPEHVDYSQLCWFMQKVMVVDGVQRRVEDVAADAELCGLVSSEGPLRFFRIPSVPLLAPGADPVPQPEPAPAPTQRLQFTRLLRLATPWLTGDDVRAWQQVIGVGVDGKFGPRTDARTRSWQADHGLEPDGIVGPRTVAKANEIQAAREGAGKNADDDLIDDFMQARNYTRASRTTPAQVKWIVAHTMESPEKGSTAEAVARWFAGPNAPQASAHFNVDNDSIVQSVREEDVAWHAKQANRYGIGIEHAGYARQTAADWRDEFSAEMLRRSARLAAYLAVKWQIPIRKLTPAQYLDGERGFIGHVDVSKAHQTPGGHYDPGPAFPWEDYLNLVRAAA